MAEDQNAHRELDSLHLDLPPVDVGEVPPTLVAAYREALSSSALPGEDEDFEDGAVERAAQFVARASLQRSAGEPAILLDMGHGDGADRRMWLAIVNDDMPFLVDSTSQIADAHGLIIRRLLHPVVRAGRSIDGRLEALSPNKDDAGQAESVIFMELERVDARVRRGFLDALTVSLGDVRAAVRDWKAMRATMLADAAMRSEGEGAELLRWWAEQPEAAEASETSE